MRSRASECKFTVTLSETKRLVVKQETETEEGETETEFVYSTYENGEQTERSTFKYEKEDGETELEFTLLKDGNMQIFAFEEENGAIEVKIGGKGGAKKYTVRIVEDENGSHYEYESANGKIDKDRD